MNRTFPVDDDAAVRAMLKRHFAAEEFHTDAVHNGGGASDGTRDLVVLDVMMPRADGLNLLRALRTRSSIPVLVLSAHGELGTGSGAAGALGEPRDREVVFARLHGVLRHPNGPPGMDTGRDAPQTFTVGDLALHPGTRRVCRRGETLSMTSTEYSVLDALLHEAGRVVTKATLSERALGRKLVRYDRSLDVHVASLRRKLGPLENGEERIKTVHGVGYQYTLV